MPTPRAKTRPVPRGKPRRGAPARRRVAACTIIARNYLAQARVLAESFFRHEPDGRFYLLVVDRLPEGTPLDPRIKVVDPEDLGVDGFYEMCFRYNVVELNTAVKPSLLLRLLEREREIIYLDPDIVVSRPLEPVRAALDAGDIVLTPHILTPIPLDGKHPSDNDILVSGVFNLGFIALRRSSEARRMLRWWEERLAELCRIDVANGLFTDQRWMDLIPCLFPTLAVLREETCNVAFWNLHERKITRHGERYRVNGKPVTFYHFSGFDPNRLTVLSKHQNRVTVVPGTPLADLLAGYSAAMFAAGHREASAWPYGYAHFDNGMPVSATLRQLYLSMEAKQRRRFGNPFATRGKKSFLAWASAPAEEHGGLSRMLMKVYEQRYDLAAAFPDVRGRDRGRFLQWAATQGAKEMQYDPSLVAPLLETVPAGSIAADATARPMPAPRPTGDEYGQLVAHVRRTLERVTAEGARVLIVSKGDTQLLSLDGRTGEHFPQSADGQYAGYSPADDATAIGHLEQLRRAGARYLALPSTALWWLDHYGEFRGHLSRRAREVFRDPHCVVFDLEQEESEKREKAQSTETVSV